VSCVATTRHGVTRRVSRQRRDARRCDRLRLATQLATVVRRRSRRRPASVPRGPTDGRRHAGGARPRPRPRPLPAARDRQRQRPAAADVSGPADRRRDVTGDDVTGGRSQRAAGGRGRRSRCRRVTRCYRRHRRQVHCSVLFVVALGRPLYTVSQKKPCHPNHGHNFVNS